MSTLQQTEQEYWTEEATPVEALGRTLERLFDDSPPVYDVVDPDALNSLFANRADGTPRVDGAGSCTYRAYEFVVESSGMVYVDDA